MFKRGYKTRFVRVVLRARAWKRFPMKLLKWGRKMPSTKQYNLVTNDEYDTRIPLHSDEAFQYGITFHAKYIGTMDVPRPTSRVEIVAAMRRVRYEFKARGVKKRKVTVDVSIDGVRITARTKTSKTKAHGSKLFGRKSSSVTEPSEIMHHPIYRIFYVSHDSSDLKIFSYIARDGATNVFKCNVFKSNRKSQAMKIVRTVGQAFEVCHKMQTNGPDQPVPSTSSAADDPVPSTSDVNPSKEAVSECEASESGGASTSKTHAEENPTKTEDSRRPQHLELLPPPPRKEGRRSPQRTTPAPTINFPDLPECVTKVEVVGFEGQGESGTPLSSQHQLQLLQERLEQQAQQTRAAVAQLLLLRDQLAAEQAARCEAQARTHQLLVHNKELLEHIAALVSHLQERERGSTRPISAQQLTLLPQKKTNEETVLKSEEYAACNGNRQSLQNENLINLIAQSNQLTQNVNNNNVTSNSQFSLNLSPTPTNNLNGPNSPTFENMTNEEIQNYLISKFQDMGGISDGISEMRNGNQQFYQNSKAFPQIPPLANHCSNTDLQGFFDIKGFKDGYNSLDEIGAIVQAMSLGQSENSLCSTSQPTTSKDSTPDAFSSDSDQVPFIMPLSHNGMLKATGEDGRVRLIVPVSPSESTTDVPEVKPDTATTSGTTLQVPGNNVATGAPILRSTSEKVPNRSEMMTTLRSQWTRHTTK